MRIYGTIVPCFILAACLFCGTSQAAELRLSEGLKIAVEKSRDLKISAYDEDVARAESLVDRARLLPSVNASFSGTALADQPSAIFGASTVPLSQRDFLAYSLGIQQTLYDFQGNASRYAAAKIRASALGIESRRVRNLVAIDFALTYFDLLESQKMVVVSEGELERLRAHMHDTQVLLDEGAVTKNDVLQAEVRLSDALQRRLAAINVRSVTESRLNNILSRPLNEEVAAIDEESGAGDLADMTQEQAWQAAVAQRPELRIVEETMKALDMDETGRKAELYPRLVVRGGYDFTQNRYQTPAGNWSLTLGVGINLFSGGSTSAELQKIAAQRGKLREQKEKLIEDIRLEVTRYVLASSTAREKIVVTKDAVRQAKENLRINRARYEEGVGTATEVLDAVTLLTVAETNYFRAVYDGKKAEAAVLYATGRDLTGVYK
ncbi:MAG: TolC family protein [Nitrospiraceae bacterium]|nr:TolC family protein [Nitrospiraceae bacterium]